MKVWKSLAVCLPLFMLTQGCGGTLYMREALPNEVLVAPPPGKVLVNIHRPSDYGGNRLYSLFDKTRFMGLSEGEQRFQYVCDPGEHVFIGYLNGSIWATVSVIKADLLPDKIYDCVIDAGYFTSSIAVNPLPQADKRRPKLPDWDEDQTTMVLDDATNFGAWEADQAEDNEEILKEFVKGEKKDRLKQLAKSDHR